MSGDAPILISTLCPANAAFGVGSREDTLNRLHTVVDSHLGTTTYSSDDANNVASVTYPNGVQTAFTYDELNRVKAAATQTVGYSYMRDPAGKITNALELDNRSITWNYDGINRLQSESIVNDPSGENGQVNYILDPVGNRSSATSSIAGPARLIRTTSLVAKATIRMGT